MKNDLLVFALSQQLCALPLSVVERIVRAVEVRPLPQAPEVVLGLINVRGQAIPVLNIRKLFRLSYTEIGLSDQIIIAHTAGRIVGLLVDNTEGVSEYREEDVITSEELFPGIEYLEGVVKLRDSKTFPNAGGIVYIYDLERFLSLEEKTAIDRLLPPGVRMSEVGG
ncbi:MAG TPA: chemotaxis protein CheW [Dissulfurispiraceae bacterium]|nr:chemotaxis protein CheW [Dissulfurispiraceae bacterium]